MTTAKWDVTTSCNLRCAHCSVAKLYFSGSRPTSLSLADRLRVLDNLADGGVTHISLLGGEPLTLREDLFSLLDHARSRGILVSLVTNGVLLNADTAHRLIEHGLSSLVVSIESARAEVHDQVRGRRTFHRTVENVEQLIRIRGQERVPSIGINTVLTRVNRDSFSLMPAFCRELGVDYWNALTLNYIGNAADNLDSLALSEAEHTAVALELGNAIRDEGPDLDGLKINFTLVYPLVWEFLREKYDLPLPQPEICCSAGSNLVYVSPDGDVHLCDRVYNSGYIGAKLDQQLIHPESLLQKSFDTVWKGGQYREMFSLAHRPETYATYDPCYRCKYLFAGTCKPCPLSSLRGGTVRFEECVRAAEYLGNIGRSDGQPRTEWERRHEFTPLGLAPSQESAAHTSMYVIPAEGVRVAPQPSGGALLQHPKLGDAIRLNAIAWEIWQVLDGETTISDLCELILATLGERLGPDGTSELVRKVEGFIDSLRRLGFLRLEEPKPR